MLVPGGRLVLEMAYNKDDGKDHTKQIEKHNLKLYSGEEVKTLLEESGFSEVSIVYYKSLWIPFKGYIVPKGMIIKATKPSSCLRTNRSKPSPQGLTSFQDVREKSDRGSSPSTYGALSVV